MLKPALRRLIGESRWALLSWHRDRFGLARTLLRCPRLLERADTISLSTGLPQLNVRIRPGTSDQSVFDEIFIRNEYDLEATHPPFIIDAGAHIGLASVFYAAKYPNSLIVSLEPESANFALLLENVRNHRNIHPLRAGLWSQSTHLEICNPEACSWSFRVTESRSGTGIDAFSVPDLMRMFGMPRIGILKMDIEGSEVEVLRTADAWIDAVDMMVIELHDRHRSGCSSALEAAISGRDFHRDQSGESIVLRRRSVLI